MHKHREQFQMLNINHPKITFKMIELGILHFSKKEYLMPYEGHFIKRI